MKRVLPTHTRILACAPMNTMSLSRPARVSRLNVRSNSTARSPSGPKCSCKTWTISSSCRFFPERSITILRVIVSLTSSARKFDNRFYHNNISACLYMTKAYCVKCKAKRDLVNPKEKKTKNNRLMIQGTCEKCGTKAQIFVASK